MDKLITIYHGSEKYHSKTGVWQRSLKTMIFGQGFLLHR